MKRTKSRAKLMSERSVRQRTARMKKRALSGNRGVSVTECKEFEIKLQKHLAEHIGVVFPLIIELRRQGHSLTDIEIMCGFKPRLLSRFMFNHPDLAIYIRQAAEVRSDDDCDIEGL